MTLRIVATGETVTVLNTHLNHRIERWQRRPGFPMRTLNARWAAHHLLALEQLMEQAEGRYVVTTGDFNVDFESDRRVRAPGMPAAVLGDTARSSWELLGVPRGAVTHPDSRRLIDYVYLPQRMLSEGLASFTRHTVLRGYHSDHRPVLVRLSLAAPPA